MWAGREAVETGKEVVATEGVETDEADEADEADEDVDNDTAPV